MVTKAVQEKVVRLLADGRKARREARTEVYELTRSISLRFGKYVKTRIHDNGLSDHTTQRVCDALDIELEWKNFVTDGNLEVSE